MSERWKYQITMGSIWGIVMTVFNVLFNLKEISFSQQIVSTVFYLQAAAYILIGIFVLGYFTWKSKQKQNL